MKLAIMQPYFFPYIGYFQLISSVDVFVIYDNIQYTKKGWINRNRILQDGNDVIFSLPLKKASDYLDVRDREISADFDRRKFINKISGVYRRAPQHSVVMPLIEKIVFFEENNLFNYIYNAVKVMCAYLCIDTEIVVSSTVDIDHSLRGEEKVVAICKALSADQYVNAIGGTELYSRSGFLEEKIELSFLKSTYLEYEQFGAPFVAWLSIVDVLMFNSVGEVKRFVFDGYEFL